ncbi:hypothetical protein [Cryobacterium zhongshanensis]|uniref:Uncharacterized protein n=1 Tax=Cryobacterium zhongshanensis TaxID=2928153 RepID=A0AA41UM89_9MICO|nr:hypothetical protein [Cryobacterium zhongshanensis]MCI4659601.1 hypothetical protein [Cryobacterium zhongshanensis]
MALARIHARADPLTTRKARGARKRLRRRTLRLIAAAAAVAGLAAAGLVVADDARASTLDAAVARYATAVAIVAASEVHAVGTITEAQLGIVTANATLVNSVGRVLGEGERAELSAGLHSLTANVANAADELRRARRTVVDQTPTYSPFGETYDSSAADLDEIHFAAAALLPTGTADLAAAGERVNAAVAAWQVEQDRLAAVAAAEAAEAARVAAEKAVAATAAAQDSSSVPAAKASGSDAGYHKNVWTSGFQSEIDRCNGAVDVSAHYGPRTIAEHWSCGGRSFPTSVGAVITITGQDAGVYRVVGVVAVLNVDVNGTGDVPSGYDLLYQTCINGSSARMSFTGLTRIT